MKRMLAKIREKWGQNRGVGIYRDNAPLVQTVVVTLLVFGLFQNCGVKSVKAPAPAPGPAAPAVSPE
jgi:hypothetical protein